MAMAVDTQQRQFGGYNLDHMPYSNAPQFTNPWSTTSAPAQSHSLYATAQHALPSGLGLDTKPLLQQPSRLNSNASYASVPVTAASAGSPLLVDVYNQEEILTVAQDMLSPNRMQSGASPGYEANITYSSAPSTTHSTYATSAPYDSMGYAPAPVRSTYALPQVSQDRRLSHDAIDASRGMIAMSQATQTTPRAMYAPRTGRGSSDSYGYPATHSTSSSISSTGTYPSYFGGSVDSSVSDYSGSDMESVSSRTLPKPYGLNANGLPPAPASMMGQFSSKVSSGTQKKHKCKVCDKRFTRPSSLQTHMYSHTGEKRMFSPILAISTSY